MPWLSQSIHISLPYNPPALRSQEPSMQSLRLKFYALHMPQVLVLFSDKRLQIWIYLQLPVWFSIQHDKLQQMHQPITLTHS